VGRHIFGGIVRLITVRRRVLMGLTGPVPKCCPAGFFNTEEDEECTKCHEIHIMSASPFVTLRAFSVFLRVKNRCAYRELRPIEVTTNTGSPDRTKIGEMRRP